MRVPHQQPPAAFHIHFCTTLNCSRIKVIFRITNKISAARYYFMVVSGPTSIGYRSTLLGAYLVCGGNGYFNLRYRCRVAALIWEFLGHSTIQMFLEQLRGFFHQGSQSKCATQENILNSRLTVFQEKHTFDHIPIRPSQILCLERSGTEIPSRLTMIPFLTHHPECSFIIFHEPCL